MFMTLIGSRHHTSYILDHTVTASSQRMLMACSMSE